MSKRHRHPNKEAEALLATAEAANWEITRRKKYFRACCPCGAHMEHIALTPSDPNYCKNKLKKMKRDCWND